MVSRRHFKIVRESLTRKAGFLYEMGGTWVTHHMGYLHREMVRYGMDRDLTTTGSPDMHKGYYTMNVSGESNHLITRSWQY